jgi:hypothetical protein
MRRPSRGSITNKLGLKNIYIKEFPATNFGSNYGIILKIMKPEEGQGGTTNLTPTSGFINLA